VADQCDQAGTETGVFAPDWKKPRRELISLFTRERAVLKTAKTTGAYHSYRP